MHFLSGTSSFNDKFPPGHSYFKKIIKKYDDRVQMVGLFLNAVNLVLLRRPKM